VTDPDVLTAADIARLAGVTRATVSNWRRRHADFPVPAGGTTSSPAYNRSEVEHWLAGRDALPEASAEDRLWRSVRAAASDDVSLSAVATQAADFLARVGHAAPASAVIPDGFLMRTLSEIASEIGRKQALDALIGRYAAVVGALPSATPEPVAALMTALAGPGEGDVVLDPATGTGTLLFSVRKYGVSRLLGQDLDTSVATLAARRYIGATDEAVAVIRKGDSLRDDQFADVRADVVLCHPPFGIQDWGLDELAGDARWEYGTPPRSEGELAWVQHSIAHLRPGGLAVVLMPPAASSRPSGRRIRAELVRHGVLRAVLGLPPGAVEPRHVPVHIWVLERPGGRGSPDPRMLLIDAAHLGTSWPSATDELVRTWTAFRDAAASPDGAVPGFWRIVPAVDLLDDSVDVTPARHIGTAVQALSPEHAATEIKALRTSLREKLAKFSAFNLGDEWEQSEASSQWRTAAITDLGHWNAVIFHRASASAPPGKEPSDRKDKEPTADLPQPPGRPVLRASDVRNGQPPSGIAPDGPVPAGWVVIQRGDVIVPAAVTDRVRARVAEQDDAGAILGRGLHLIRPDPERLDPWFLGGFLSSPASVRSASGGPTGTRIDVRRLTVPVLPLGEQRRYGAEFRELHYLDTASRDLATITTLLSRTLGDNLVAGRLKPRAQDLEKVQTSAHDLRGDEGDDRDGGELR
jgi:hypothetical protein